MVDNNIITVYTSTACVQCTMTKKALDRAGITNSCCSVFASARRHGRWCHLPSETTSTLSPTTLMAEWSSRT